MLLRRVEIKALLESVAKTWEANIALFTDIDSRFGDGDHGMAAKKIAGLIRRRVDEWGDDESVKGFLNELARGISEIGGGSAGPLYGTIFEGFAEPLRDDTDTIDASTLRAMLACAGELMEMTTKARVGDKTMMDALLPAVAAAQVCEGDVPEILLAAATAAGSGADATKKMVSKYGRARFYGEDTLGTPDAGAMSTALLFKGLEAGLTQ
ncbi:MAG: dihydroxyacetone kinase subunit L [Propionibacteriaceae bacterium]|jgi:dihydroxyacetone kinase-like protein|nr:dihydroxyacetone kinase subunit L [Propionibacteriaceae bacterium]